MNIKIYYNAHLNYISLWAKRFQNWRILSTYIDNFSQTNLQRTFLLTFSHLHLQLKEVLSSDMYIRISIYPTNNL